MKKLISFTLAAIIAIGGLSGCGKKKQTAAEVTGDLQIIDFNQYKDADDVPDWNGEKLNLKYFVDGLSSVTNRGEISPDDVVTPEIGRITGVTLDPSEAMDLGESSWDAKIAQMIAANDWPDLAKNIPDLEGLIDRDSLWRLDELIEKYCPNLYKLFGPESDSYGPEWKAQMERYGGVYAICMGTGWNLLPIEEFYEKGIYDMTEEEMKNIRGNKEHAYGDFSVREDILLKLFPDAHSNAELEQIYNERGYFTEDEIFDVPINSTEDFVKLLYDIKDLGLKDGKNEVYPFYTHNGGDNWYALVNMGQVWGYYRHTGAIYYSYFDLEDNEMKFTLKEDWFKDIVKTYNKMIRDGVASKESLVDTETIFKEKLNNGRYIVTNYPNIPTEAELGGKYRYRTVYQKYGVMDDKVLFPASVDTLSGKYSIFKENLTETQAIQVLRMLDFLASNPGQKLQVWGPRKAGLYTEDENGNLAYTDEALKNEMVNSSNYPKDVTFKYNIGNKSWPAYPSVGVNQYNPYRYYGRETTWKSAYTPAALEGFELKTTPSRYTYMYENYIFNDIPGFRDFWNKREAFENALLKTFAADSEEEFEKRYAAMLSLAEKNGLSDENMKKYDKLYKENYNKEYMPYVEELREKLGYK